MHTVYEGVAVYHLNLLLHYLIDTRKWLSFAELNHAVQAHHYGYTECDTKPNKINRGQTIDADFRIKLSGNMSKICGEKLLHDRFSFTDDDTYKTSTLYGWKLR